jgi:hypothetical protein
LAAPDNVQIAPANRKPGFAGRDIYEAARSEATRLKKPRRGGSKEDGWDNIGIFGWLGDPAPVTRPAWNATIDDHH